MHCHPPQIGNYSWGGGGGGCTDHGEDGKRKRHQKKGIMRKAIAIHMCYKCLYIS